MLAVSCKKGEETDLVKPMKEFIHSNYSKKEAKELEDTLLAISNTRKRVIDVLNRHDADHEGSIEIHQTYLQNLLLISSRFNFGRREGSSFFRNKVTSIMVPFTWHDAFRPIKDGTDYDVNYEKAAVIFNIGALHSLAGIKEDRTSKEGLVRACKEFQKAAGVFSYLSSHHEFELALTIDTSSLTYKMLYHLMLAQAQACYFEQAVKAKMATSLIAKLAQGTANLFGNALAASEKNPLKEWLEKTKYKYAQHMSYQRECFMAASLFWQSKAHLEKEEYGIEIAHLYSAKDRCANAQKYEAELVSGLVESRAKLYELIVTRLSQAVKDNETVYHYPVPSNVKDIEAKFVVKATDFVLDSPNQGDSPFNKLIPLRVQEAASVYLQQLHAFSNDVIQECREAEELTKTRLSSMNLPSALEALETNVGFPPKVLERVKEVQFKGGWQALIQLSDTVAGASVECASALEEIKNQLKTEAQEDQDLRVKFGTRWNRMGSAQITASFHKDIETVQKYLKVAATSDRTIIDEMGKYKESMSVLALSPEELEAKLPKESVSPAKTQASENLKNLLDQLSSMLDKRKTQVASLEKRVADENIVPALLVADGKMTAEQVYDQEKKKFEDLQKDIAISLDEQKGLMEKIVHANDEFVKSRDVSQLTKAREEVIHGVNTAADRFDKLLANLNEGQKFYADIMKDYLQPLKQTVADFLVARDQEKLIIMDQITKDMARFQPTHAPSGLGGPTSYHSYQPIAQPAPQQYQPAPQQYQAVAPEAYPMFPPPFDPSTAPSHFGGQPQPQQLHPQPQPQQLAFNQISTPHNPNLNYPVANPVYPQNQGSGVSYRKPDVYLNAPNASAPPSAPSSSDKKEAGWACPTCTFSNTPTSMVCAMCNTDNPNPPPPRSPQSPQKSKKDTAGGKDDTKVAKGWRKFFG